MEETKETEMSPSILEKVDTVGDVMGQDSEPLLKETKRTDRDTETELDAGKSTCNRRAKKVNT